MKIGNENLLNMDAMQRTHYSQIIRSSCTNPGRRHLPRISETQRNSSEDAK